MEPTESLADAIAGLRVIANPLLSIQGSGALLAADELERCAVRLQEVHDILQDGGDEAAVREMQRRGSAS